MVDMAVTKATGIPSFSIILAIADPLRVQDPQVATWRTASTPPTFIGSIVQCPAKTTLKL